MVVDTHDVAIVGGGLVGLATAMALTETAPKVRVIVLEKEAGVARHQSGRNSGVIHSGIYYKPGSFKASFARAGNRSMVAFCEQQDIPHEVSGKVIVATESAELPRLDGLYERGLANELQVSRLSPAELREVEPHAAGLAAIRVASTGIVDYKQVADRFAQIAQARGAILKTRAGVEAIIPDRDALAVETTAGTVRARFLVNCAGLQSDRIARMAGVQTDLRIVPFRGEYYELRDDRRYLVRNLVYPVPDPSFPFLGVHFTRMIGGAVHAGPNAVLSLSREGYTKWDVRVPDVVDVLAYSGFWTLAARHWRSGLEEMVRSFSKPAFVESLQRLVPEIRAEDLIPSAAGVRAQALWPDGSLADDFVIQPGPRSLHVLNAPSPAATASIEIGRSIARQIPAEVTGIV